MSVHNSDYFIFFLYRHILYSLDQTLKYLLKASILCFKRKELCGSRLCKEKYKVCKVLCSISFSLFKKCVKQSNQICSVLIVDDF